MEVRRICTGILNHLSFVDVGEAEALRVLRLGRGKDAGRWRGIHKGLPFCGSETDHP
jgi:hypothetical protein